MSRATWVDTEGRRKVETGLKKTRLGTRDNAMPCHQRCLIAEGQEYNTYRENGLVCITDRFDRHLRVVIYLFILKKSATQLNGIIPPNVHPFVHLREAYLTYRHPVPRAQPPWHNSGVTAQAATVAHSISYLVRWMFCYGT